MMDYHELINELSYEDNPYVLDYIDDAVEMLEHLYSELKAANARCETLSKMVTQYQDELIPGYRERAEKAERERDAAISDMEALMWYSGEGCKVCAHAKEVHRQPYVRLECDLKEQGKPLDCLPKWRGAQEG